MMLSGWSLVLWCFRYLWDNYSSVLESNWQYVAAYFLLAGLVSLVVCYWKGPVTDHRSLNLIMWTIQGIALAFIYNSTQIQEVSIAVIVTVLVFYNFPTSIMRFIKLVW